MIQRIQSLFLFGVFLCTVLLFFTGVASVVTASHHYNFSIWGFVEMGQDTNQLLVSTRILLFSTVLLSFLSLIILFNFKNRILQIRLSRLCLLLLVAYAVGLFFYFEHALEQVPELSAADANTTKTIHYALGAILPIIAILFTLLALNAIKKDEALVRSADRIR